MFWRQTIEEQSRIGQELQKKFLSRKRRQYFQSKNVILGTKIGILGKNFRVAKADSSYRITNVSIVLGSKYT